MAARFWMIVLLVGTLGCSQHSAPETYQTWEVRGGTASSIRYSALDQIDTSNVDRLEVAWTYRTGDADTAKNSQIQANAIVVDETIYGISPKLKVFALDAATGREQWSFNPFPEGGDIVQWLNVNRGVTYWEGRSDCRILFTAGPILYAIDADTGQPIKDFGDDGQASLKQGIPERFSDFYVVATSPGMIYEDLIIIGSRVSEGTDAAPGDIRAFNVRTGELEWTFHTIPHPGEFGHDSWEDPEAWKHTGGANSWAGMAVDRERGIVFAPTGSAAPDFYGGNRKGKNLFANTLLALDAETGERIWHFQAVHHDLWDRDLPSPPSLIAVNHQGESVDAVVQTTKMGYVYLFDRETGEPLFEIEEQSVPTESPLKGEVPWPTQPAPVQPPPLIRQHMGPDDINPFVSDSVRDELQKQLASLDHERMFSPPSLRGKLMFPGFDGGAEWGGNAFDPETGLLYVNSNEVPWIMTMVPAGGSRGSQNASRNKTDIFAMGRESYMTSCIACHGPDLKGGGNNPSLVDVEERYTPQEMLELVNSGRRMMPSFKHLPEAERKAMVNYLAGERHFDVSPSDLKMTNGDERKSPYVMTGYNKFRTPGGYPAVSPPWGTLAAIDMSSGKYAWQVPLGEYPALAEQGIPTTGTENYGGPVVTAGGLVFIAATLDEKIRAFDKATGELLWEQKLPAAGYATPSVYEVDGRQYVVIACGGGKLGTTSGDAYVAFALPERLSQ